MDTTFIINHIKKVKAISCCAICKHIFFVMRCRNTAFWKKPYHAFFLFNKLTTSLWFVRILWELNRIFNSKTETFGQHYLIRNILQTIPKSQTTAKSHLSPLHPPWRPAIYHYWFNGAILNGSISFDRFTLI